MKLGVFLFATDYAIRVDELARELEARGFESLFVPEHTHIPVSRRTPFPGGGELPRHYYHTLDSFVALSAAAAVTTRLKVATGVCLLIERDTIITAKEVASLDLLSNGRFLFGVGAGWNAEEMENHGTVFATRFARLREQVLALSRIWAEDEPAFHGEHVSFDPIWSWPKPVQEPRPPVLVGGNGGRARQCVVDFGDAWMPIARPPAEILAGIEDLRRRADAAGRDPRAIGVSVFGAAPDRATLDAYEGAGVERAVLRLPPEGRDRVLPLLDQWAALL